MKTLKLKCGYEQTGSMSDKAFMAKCGLVHADDEKSRAYSAAPKNSRTVFLHNTQRNLSHFNTT